jgi:hypothetical protein
MSMGTLSRIESPLLGGARTISLLWRSDLIGGAWIIWVSANPLQGWLLWVLLLVPPDVSETLEVDVSTIQEGDAT